MRRLSHSLRLHVRCISHTWGGQKQLCVLAPAEASPAEEALLQLLPPHVHRLTARRHGAKQLSKCFMASGREPFQENDKFLENAAMPLHAALHTVRIISPSCCWHVHPGSKLQMPDRRNNSQQGPHLKTIKKKPAQAQNPASSMESAAPPSE